MRRRLTIMIIMTAVVALAHGTAAQTLYIPAAANADGTAGTQWHSDLQVKARGEDPASFAVELLKGAENNSDPLRAEFNVSPGQSLRLADVVANVFEYSGSGALRITTLSGALLVTSRTFNDDPEGTYGQYVPAISEEEAIAYGELAALLQLSRSSNPNDGFRTNVGFVNLDGQRISVEVELYDAAGAQLGTVERQIRAYGYLQHNDIFDAVDASDVDDGYAMVRTTTEGGRFISYASVVDNRSGDGIFIPGLKDAAPEIVQDKMVVFEFFARDT